MRHPLSGALLRYRIMATIVGVLLVPLVLVFFPLDLFADEGTTAYDIGETGSQWLGVAHGYLYMIFLVTAALLARRAGWSIPFTLTTLVLGTVPFASFYGERRATASVRAEMAATPV